MGTGEVVRHLATSGPERVRKAALFGTIPPFMLKTGDNPEGVDGKVFDGIKAAVANDRYAFFESFFNNFYNVDVLGGTRISDRAWQASFNVAAGCSPFASYACVDTWLTDFRADLVKIDVPVLVMHGTADRILMDRGGNPTINPFINPDGEKNLYNARQPADDVANYLGPWSKILENGGYPPEEAEAAAMQVLPDILRYDRTKHAAPTPTAASSPTTSSACDLPG